MNLVSVTGKGQIVIPAALRKKYHLKKGSKLKIEEANEGTMILEPLTVNPVEKTKGILKGKNSLLDLLLDERKKESLRG